MSGPGVIIKMNTANKNNGRTVTSIILEFPLFLLGYVPYILIKKGNATNTAPERTRKYTFEIKYGNTINPMPQQSGITAFCFFAIDKKP
jgi:hypothetical protein